MKFPSTFPVYSIGYFDRLVTDLAPFVYHLQSPTIKDKIINTAPADTFILYVIEVRIVVGILQS